MLYLLLLYQNKNIKLNVCINQIYMYVFFVCSTFLLLLYDAGDRVLLWDVVKLLPANTPKANSQLQIRGDISEYFSCFSMKTYVVGTHYKYLVEVLVTCTHNLHFCGEIRKIPILFGRQKWLIWSYDTMLHYDIKYTIIMIKWVAVSEPGLENMAHCSRRKKKENRMNPWQHSALHKKDGYLS